MSQGLVAARVLVVDDHHDSRRLLGVMLSAAGYRVREAEGFASAVALAEAEPFDLLVTDLALGDGDGCDLLARVSARRPVRAVAVTGHAESAHAERVEAAGFDALIAKPVDVDAVLSVVRTLASGGPLLGALPYRD